MNARKLIIDCDPGIDDSLALMLAAASKELDLVGITTVSGNVPASMGAKNALKILSMIGKPDVPVYVGEETPLVATTWTRWTPTAWTVSANRAGRMPKALRQTRTLFLS